MRVAIVTESFLPQVNGVANTVRHVVDRLQATGHEPLVIAPGAGPAEHAGVPVVRVRSVGLPGYRSFPLGLPDAAVHRTLERFAPDVVHLASPICLGAVGLRAARRLGIPTVAVYQTDIGGFARQYGLRAESTVARWVGHLHRRATRTLVPSTTSYVQLAALGVHDLHVWRRGVSHDLFSPRRRDAELRRSWGLDGPGGALENGTEGAPAGRLAIGYVGRLAPEKRVRRLVELADLPGARLVVVGDGPERAWLQRRLPDAVFTGMLGGAELARAFASLDVFVHLGEAETFCQTVQEAQASGVPVLAPAAGGPLDLVDPGVTGLLHDPADRSDLRRQVERLVASRGLRGHLAVGGLAAVAHRGWGRTVDDLVRQHYAAVVGDVTDRLAA